MTTTPRRPPGPALLVVAAFSRHRDALLWGQKRLEHFHGPLRLLSRPFDFEQTRYYEPTMGAGLQKQLAAFDLVAADSLAPIKLQTNALEQELAGGLAYPEPRPLNLDPGLLTLGKFSLATTKDQAHRVYLGQGIYAEATLRYHAGRFEPWPWTYEDYRQSFVLTFFGQARQLYHSLLRQRPEDARP